ncbi:FkbM family methyltransferase [Dictyobacter arantiisoli]|uniref:Methyltransferase FkbM domain-containing protein n=1 Tax=Dictyobacter arantiisoli TaxID=2014874 RepID=A0A5A5TBY1_9CHLR|nr:FkbM family methyltransferase [Dictyobacter arantiisoli]GCF08942.1 hypothetical protein KDI_25060 [Dictyobacter arantiisoli]
MFYFRDDTNDHLIYDEIFKRNAYNLPASFSDTDIIIDIGAHLGFFTYAAAERGAGIVYAIEAEAENYKLAKENLQAFIDQNKVKLLQAAIWRSDEKGAVLFHSGHPRRFDCQIESKLINTGGGDVLWQTSGTPISTLAFDDLVTEASQQQTKRIHILKIDCEGSEWPILLTSQTLHLIDEIHGEFHEIGGPYDTFSAPFSIPGYQRFTVEELQTFLEQQNFTFSYTRLTRSDGLPSRLGMFTAINKAHVVG